MAPGITGLHEQQLSGASSHGHHTIIIIYVSPIHLRHTENTGMLQKLHVLWPDCDISLRFLSIAPNRKMIITINNQGRSPGVGSPAPRAASAATSTSSGSIWWKRREEKKHVVQVAAARWWCGRGGALVVVTGMDPEEERDAPVKPPPHWEQISALELRQRHWTGMTALQLLCRCNTAAWWPDSQTRPTRQGDYLLRNCSCKQKLKKTGIKMYIKVLGFINCFNQCLKYIIYKVYILLLFYFVQISVVIFYY